VKRPLRIALLAFDIAVLLLSASAVFYPYQTNAIKDRIRGSLDASRDVARGHYYEMRPPGSLDSDGLYFHREYVRLLKSRYGVEERSQTVPPMPWEGCVLWNSTTPYTEGYNTVSRAAANQKFGRDVFKESMDAARAFMDEAGPLPRY
jgi:hypothetical protein